MPEIIGKKFSILKHYTITLKLDLVMNRKLKKVRGTEKLRAFMVLVDLQTYLKCPGR